VRDLLKRVFQLYIIQDYDIDNAFGEISEKVSKFGEVINRLLETKSQIVK
jgi:uncharacterized protein Usg